VAKPDAIRLKMGHFHPNSLAGEGGAALSIDTVIPARQILGVESAGLGLGRAQAFKGARIHLIGGGYFQSEIETPAEVLSALGLDHIQDVKET